MAKPRRNYRKKKPAWQWIIFYLLIAGVIFSLLYYSGILGIGGPTNYLENNQSELIFE